MFFNYQNKLSKLKLFINMKYWKGRNKNIQIKYDKKAYWHNVVDMAKISS